MLCLIATGQRTEKTEKSNLDSTMFLCRRSSTPYIAQMQGKNLTCRISRLYTAIFKFLLTNLTLNLCKLY
jgi:hypothetical protein